ncbi:redoxin domain-containing protein [Natronoarchaeum sp. GCM10025703]|uniref:redoxin domain-containing protein n=1 Tax=unclassified Natronoarchaeum TaxID=2620183 RepID=UPI00360F110C
MVELDFDVVDLPERDHVEEGDVAPDFTRPLVNEEFWEDRSLSDLTEDGPVLLVFYTMDGAFPATYIWNEIRGREWETEFDVRIVGLSISDPYSHKRLIEERGIDYDLFSDPNNTVAVEYGIPNDLDGMTGVSEPRPAVYLLDDERVVEYAWVAQEWPQFPDYDEIEAALSEL